MHPRSIIREALRQEAAIEKKDVQRKKTKDKATQTNGEDLDKYYREVESFIRVCKIVSTMKTPRELYQIGLEEYPDLDVRTIKSVVDAHFPSCQNPKEKKRPASTQGIPTRQEAVKSRGDSQWSALRMITNYESTSESETEEPSKKSVSLQEDLRLSESRDSSFMITLSSEEEGG